MATVTTPPLASEFSLTGKTALVTGGARGLGLTIAHAFIEAGADVWCLDVLPGPFAPEWDPILAEANRKNRVLQYVQVDVTDDVAIKAAFEQVEHSARSPIQVCVAAAGIQKVIDAIDYDVANYRRMLDVNVTGVFLTAQAAARQMIKHSQGGSIVLIASMSGTIANRGLLCNAYNTSKSAVIQMARSLAVEWGKHNIRVNSLSPGYILTAMTEALLQERPDYRKQWVSDNPLGRIALPVEFKGPALFLASNASSFMTGSDLRVDGGHCAWSSGYSNSNPSYDAEASTGPSKTQKVQNQVNEVVGIMQQNIDSVMARGERLNDIEGKTDNLQQSSAQFRRGASGVRRRMWWKDMKWRAIIVIAIIILLIIIIVPSVKASQNH